MKKYLFFLKIAVIEFLTHRVRLIFSLLDNLANPLVIIVAISGAAATKGIHTNNLISYYLGIALFLPFLQVSVEETISEMTFTGQINNFLVKPLSFYKWMIFRELGQKISTILTIFPIVILTIIIGRAFGYLDFSNLSNVVLGLAISSLSFLLAFNISYALGLFSFWIDEMWAVRNIREVLVSFLGGAVVPYYLFPDLLNRTLYYSPFPYLMSWPSRVLRIGLDPKELFISIIWIAITFFLIKALWKKAVVNYSHVAN